MRDVLEYGPFLEREEAERIAAELLASPELSPVASITVAVPAV